MLIRVSPVGPTIDIGCVKTDDVEVKGYVRLEQQAHFICQDIKVPFAKFGEAIICDDVGAFFPSVIEDTCTVGASVRPSCLAASKRA